MSFLDEQLRAIEAISNSKALNEYESALRDDPWVEDDPAYQPVFEAIAKREQMLKASEAEGLRFQRAERQKAMIAALTDLDVKGSGISIKKQGRGGRVFTPKGSGFSVPSGSSVSLSDEGDGVNDALAPGIKDFVERYVKPNMTGNYVDPGSSLVKPQVLTHDEVVDKLGIVPPDAGRAALEGLLKDAAADGGIERGDIDVFAKDNGLPKSVAAEARAIANKAEKAAAGDSPAALGRKVHLAPKQPPIAPKQKAPAKKEAPVSAEGAGAGISESDILARMIKSGRTDFGTAAFSRDFDAAVAAEASAGGGGRGGNGSGGGNGGGGGGVFPRFEGDQGDDKNKSKPAAAGGSPPPNDPPNGPDKPGDKAKVAAEKRGAERKTREGRAELDAVMDASHKAGALSDDDYEAHLSAKAFDGQIPSAERRRATSKLGALGAKRQTKDAREKAAEARDAKKHEDFAKKTLAGAEEQERKKTEQAEKDKAASDATASTRFASLTRTGAFAALGVLRGLSTAFRSGREVGDAAGALVSGLSHAFTGAASGLIHVGDGILSLVLSPFGGAGAAVAKLTGGLGQALIGSLSAGGAVLSAGVRIGVGLVSGIVAGIATLGSIGIGAVLGGILGSVLPGAGTLAGALFGAGLGGAVAGTVLHALAGIVGSVSSALGQALGAIGDAFGKVGSAIGDALTSIKGVLSDLIETGGKFASASISVARGGNLSLGAAGGVGALSQILTGSPGGLNNVFTGFGHMSQYQGDRLKAFGVAGATGTDPLGDIVKSAEAYRRLDPIRRQLLVQGGYEGNEQIGNLFALNAYSPGLAGRAAQVARETALTPKEAVQDATLSLNLAEVQSQLDRLKTRMLSDLMPAINATLGAFTTWFTGHESAIVGGLEAFGKWVYVKLPTYLQAGANGFFEMGKSLAASLPAVAEFGKSLYAGFASIFNGVRAGLGALVTTAGLLLTGLGAALALSPVTAWASAGVLKAGLGMSASGVALTTSPGLNPHGLDGFFGKIGAAGPGLTKSIQGAQDGANGFLGGAFGTEAERARDWQKTRPHGVNVRVDVHTTSTQHHTIDMTRLQHSVVEHVSEQSVRAIQRASA